MVDGIGRGHPFPRGRIIFPGIEISVETREIAAADFQSQPVSLAKNVAG